MSEQTFGALLREHRLRTPGYTADGRASASMSQWDLAASASIDPTYVSLLERGKRRAVNRDVVLAFAEALGLTPSETDRLLYAAGHAPQTDYQQLYEARFGTIDSQTKWCAGCQDNLPIRCFSGDRSRPDGLFPYCRSCKASKWTSYSTKVALRRIRGRAS